MTSHRSLAALAVVLAAMLAFGLAQQEPAPATVSTASYPLFPVDDSGVTGQLQIVERMEGGTHLILTLVGIQEGSTYPAALYVGSCGPDRPIYLELQPVTDPYVGITASEFSFVDLTEGDYFVYVFDGETIDRPETEGLDVPAVACGEVGVGAVEGQP